MDLTSSDEVRPLSIGTALHRGWWLVLGCAVLLAGLAAAATLKGSPSYTSSTSVFLQPIDGNALSPDSTVNGQQVLVAMETEAGLVDSPDVLRTVSTQLGVTEDSLRAAVKAKVPTNTKTVRISFRADGPQAAERGAAEVASAFLAFRQDQAAQAQHRQMVKLDAQSAATYRSLKKLPPAAKYNAADRATQQVLTSRLASIQANIAELVSSDTYPGNVSSAATLPSGPDGFSPVLLIAVAALIGLGLGAMVAIWRQARDDRLGASAGPTVANLPVLSVVHRRRGAGIPLLTDLQSGDDVGEWFRQLKIGVTTSAPQAKSFSVSHVSPAGQTGSYTANLGITMASTGLRMVLVDGYGPGTPGSLVAVLGERLTPGPTASTHRLAISEGNDILVVSAGSATDDQAILDESRLGQLIRSHTRRADYVLVAAPSLTTANGEVTCLATDATLLVIEQDRTRTSDVQAIVDRTGMLGVQLCGLFSVPTGGRSPRQSVLFHGVSRRVTELRRRSSPTSAMNGLRRRAWRRRPVVDKS